MCRTASPLVFNKDLKRKSLPVKTIHESTHQLLADCAPSGRTQSDDAVHSTTSPCGGTRKRARDLCAPALAFYRAVFQTSQEPHTQRLITWTSSYTAVTRRFRRPTSAGLAARLPPTQFPPQPLPPPHHYVELLTPPLPSAAHHEPVLYRPERHSSRTTLDHKQPAPTLKASECRITQVISSRRDVR